MIRDVPIPAREVDADKGRIACVQTPFPLLLLLLLFAPNRLDQPNRKRVLAWRNVRSFKDHSNHATGQWLLFGDTNQATSCIYLIESHAHVCPTRFLLPDHLPVNNN